MSPKIAHFNNFSTPALYTELAMWHFVHKRLIKSIGNINYQKVVILVYGDLLWVVFIKKKIAGNQMWKSILKYRIREWCQSSNIICYIWIMSPIPKR